MHPLAVASVDAQDLNRLVVCRAEPVRQSGVELGDFAGTHRDVVLAEDQAHLSGQHVQPFVALVGSKLAVSFRRPVPVGEPLTVRAEVKKETRRAVDIHGEVLDSAGTLLADAEGTFVVMPEQRRRELERRYGRARTKPAPEATGEDERRLEERSDYSRIDEAFTKVREAVAAEEKQREQEEGPLFSRAERGVRT